MPSFQDFSLQPATLAVLANMEITEPTPVQVQAIPALLAGNDVVGQSATGSGKTLAYGIPLVERLARNRRAVQALVLVPTRELAVQVNAVLSRLAGSRRLSTALLVGGRPYGKQISALQYGAQIVVGTPGRVKDHLDRGSFSLSELKICVLDEADQMLDSGFVPVIEEILSSTPETRQMALFSATMPDWVVKLQKKFLKNPVSVAISRTEDTRNAIEQIVYQVPQEQKIAALCTLLHSTRGESSLIFGRTKVGVEKLGKQLSKLGFAVGTFHGDKSQRAREEVLTAFRHGQVRTLLATNVAARGLDIQGIYQVINYELPESSELFTHRIGRTGRMGREGKAITLLVPSDVPKWRRMARSLGQAVALQRLAINEEAIVPTPLTRAEMSDQRESEQRSEQRPVRENRPFMPDQERGRRERPSRDAQRPFVRGGSSDAWSQEQRSEQRPVRENRPFTSDQERGRRARPERNSQVASDFKRQPERPAGNRTPARASEGFPLSEPPYASGGKERENRRSGGKQPGFGKTVDQHRIPALAIESSHRPIRKKAGVKPIVRTGRAAVSGRSEQFARSSGTRRRAF